MARYVLVAFDDNAEADGFVNVIQAAGSDATMKVVGVFFKPTLFCDCKVLRDGLTKGQKYGLTIHRGCGKPRRMNWQHPRNLIEESINFGEHVHIKNGPPMYIGFHEPLMNANAEGAT